MVHQRRVERKALLTTVKGALEWPLVGVKAFNVILQRIDASEAAVTELALDSGAVGVMNLEMTL